MCSKHCPCDLSQRNFGDLNKWKRSPAQEQHVYFEVNGQPVPFVTEEGLFPLFGPAGQTASLSQCEHFDWIQEDLPDYEMPSQELLSVLGYFEQRYKCGGICTPGLFHYALPPALVPDSGCVYNIKEEV